MSEQRKTSRFDPLDFSFLNQDFKDAVQTLSQSPRENSTRVLRFNLFLVVCLCHKIAHAMDHMAPKRPYHANHITGDMSEDYLPLWDNDIFVSNQEPETGFL